MIFSKLDLENFYFHKSSLNPDCHSCTNCKISSHKIKSGKMKFATQIYFIFPAVAISDVQLTELFRENFPRKWIYFYLG